LSIGTILNKYDFLNVFAYYEFPIKNLIIPSIITLEFVYLITFTQDDVLL